MGHSGVAVPSGTVTFLFTDIEGSTRLWQENPSAMRAAVARHDPLERGAIEDRGRVVFSTTDRRRGRLARRAPSPLVAAF
jgi:class 3 adenylate cyclase